MFFCWQLSIFYKGHKKQLLEDDLYEALDEHRSEKLGNQLENAWNLQLQNRGTPSLWKALRTVFGLELLLYGIFLVPIELIFRISQPLLIGELMKYYTPNQNLISKDEAYLYSFLIILASLLYVIACHWYGLGIQHLGMKIRVACSALLYRKSLKLSQTTLAETTVGQLVNLLSNDVSKFDFAATLCHFLWMGPLETLLIAYFLHSQLGPTALVGIAIFLLFIPLQMGLSKKISKYRMSTALKTDERIRLMTEIIGGIKVIKMYTWEKPFVKLVERARKLEMDQIRSSSYFRAVNMIFQVFLSRTAAYFCILTYILTGNTINPEYVYVLTSFYEIIRLGSLVFFPMAMTSFGEAITSINRIEKFLTNSDLQSTGTTSVSNKEIQLDQVSVRWDNSSDGTLDNVTMVIKPDQLVAIIGPVGSGKSTLLQVLLNEVPAQGMVKVNGTVSYASQEAWLFAGTIRDNILFGEQLDENRYDQVVKVCALEPDFAIWPHGDRTLVGERGVMVGGGQKARINLARAVYRKADFYFFDDPLSAVDGNVGYHLFDSCIRKYLEGKGRVLVTHQLQYLKGVDRIYLVENGKITSGTYQDLISTHHEFLEDKVEEKSENVVNTEEPKEVKESQIGGTVSGKVYRKYLTSGGTIFVIMVVFALQILIQVIGNGSDYFLSYWVNQEQKNITTPLDSDQSLYLYTGLICSLVILCLTASITFFKFCINASTNLHNTMFRKIVHMSMRFFHTNPSGRILNRFSQDMGLIDESLPICFGDTVQVTLNVTAIVVLLSVINFWILVPTAIMFLLFYCFRNVYLATSRNLKRIEGRTRSPIFSHLSTSLQGLPTIRAYQAQEAQKRIFDQYQDVHSSGYYLFIACDSAFGFWLDLVCVGYLALVTLSFLFLDSGTMGASVGLSINQSIMMTGMLQWGMKQWSQLENQMTSVERVVEYSEMVPEVDGSKKTPPETWPRDGTIEFKAVSFQYSPEDPLVLNQLDFTIKPMEKIGIVGRTGAGKSSLISVIFRLADFEGDVFVGGVNTKEISLESLRSRISIIPQEPVLFSGSVRKNLDPFDQHQDVEIWQVLDEVGMKGAISELASGLSAKVAEGGSNFSVGQRQLICLARAMLRKNKILILDEATANVDQQTDEFIQKTTKDKFRQCTVLTIAHRLNSVMDCDRILVMAAGSVVEFDSPKNLLRDENGVFYRMVQQAGGENSLKTKQNQSE